jgi:branched-chain amino acid transport system ATP-binding protein
MLSIQGIDVYYGAIHALKNLSAEVNEGEIVAIIGSNGAGKSTLLRAISGLLIQSKAAHEIVRLGIGHAPEGRRIFTNMSVLENLQLGAFTRKDGDVSKDMAKIMTRFPRLKERIKQNAGTLSGGEQQMLAIGRALMSRPKLLLLDEPSLGLAPNLVAEIFDIVSSIQKEGTTVLLVEQNAHKALEIAHRAYVIETGSIVLSGSGKELLNDPKVKEAYLGG